MRNRQINDLLRLTYWPSVIGSLGWAVLLLAVWLDGGGSSTLGLWISGWVLLPFLLNELAARFVNSARGALAVNALLVLAFGLTLPVIAYQPIPVFVFLTCALTNGAIIGGPPQIVRVVLAFAVGGGIGAALSGFHVSLESGMLTLAWSAACLLLVPPMSGLATWKYAILLRRARSKLEEASLTDHLTGLRNRRFLGQVIREDCAAAVRSWGANTSESVDLLFFMIDLDHFKKINDTRGHDAGDRVLTEFSRRLRKLVRESDYAVRWGGEEFLVVLRSNHRDQARIFATRVLDAIRETAFELDSTTELQLTCSMGWAAFPFVPDKPREFSWEEVVDWADRGLLMAKNSGRSSAVGVRAATRDVAALKEGLRSDARFEALAGSGELVVERAEAAA